MNKCRLKKQQLNKKALTFYVYPIQFIVVDSSSNIDKRGSVENHGCSFTHFLQQVTIPDVAFKCTQFCLTLVT